MAVRNVFVYGTLIAPEVLKALIKRVPPSVSAVAHDFHRYSVKGCLYPAILPLSGDNVVGKVLFDLTEEEITVLDEFEDKEYRRETIEPTVQQNQLEALNISIGLPLYAYIYVWQVDAKALFGEWDYEYWRKNYLSAFLAKYIGEPSSELSIETRRYTESLNDTSGSTGEPSAV